MAEVVDDRLPPETGFATLRSDETGPYFATALARLILRGDPFSFSLPIDQLYRLREVAFLAPLYERWQKSNLERNFRSRLGGLPVGQSLREEVVIQDSDHHLIAVTVDLSQDRSAGDGTFTVRFDFPRAVRHVGVAQWSEAYARDWVETHPGGSVVTIREGSQREGVVPADLSSEQQQVVTYVLNFFAEMVRRVLTDERFSPAVRARLRRMEHEGINPRSVNLQHPEFDAVAYWAQSYFDRAKGLIRPHKLLLSEIFRQGELSGYVEVMGVSDNTQSRILVCIPELSEVSESFLPERVDHGQRVGDVQSTGLEHSQGGSSFHPSSMRNTAEVIVGITLLMVRFGVPALREWISSLVPWGRHRSLKKP